MMENTRRFIAAGAAAFFLFAQVGAHSADVPEAASSPRKSVLVKPAAGVEPLPAKESTGTATAVKSSSKKGISLAHKVFGYGTLAFAVCAMATGIAMSFQKGNVPEYLAVMHDVSIYGTTGMAMTAMVTGYVGYWDSVDFKGGLNTRNSHMLLGTIAALGFVCSMFLAYYYKGEKGLDSRDGFSPHCDAAKVSGIVLAATIIVVQF